MAWLQRTELTAARSGKLPVPLARTLVAPQVDEVINRVDVHAATDCAAGPDDLPVGAFASFGEVLACLHRDVRTLKVRACGTCTGPGSSVFEMVQALEQWVDLAPTEAALTYQVTTASDVNPLDLAAATRRVSSDTIIAAKAVLMMRMRHEFHTRLGVPYGHGDVRGQMHPLLQDWWAARFADWSATCAKVVARARAAVTAGRLEWEGPMQMVTPTQGLPSWEPTAPCLAADAEPAFLPLLAVADYVGTVNRAGQAPTPVLLLPATADMRDSGWVSLGPAREGVELDALLAACSAVFTQDVATAAQVAAIHTAMGLDPCPAPPA